jgi:hypothetical protein
VGSFGFGFITLGFLGFLLGFIDFFDQKYRGGLLVTARRCILDFSAGIFFSREKIGRG